MGSGSEKFADPKGDGKELEGDDNLEKISNDPAKVTADVVAISKNQLPYYHRLITRAI